MLGEYLGEIRGRIMSARVLPTEGGNRAIEYSGQGQGELLGIELNQMMTIKSLASGRFYEAHGLGVLTTEDNEMINWTGHGIGRPNGPKSASFRGARFYRTVSQKLAHFDGLVAVIEVEIDNGNVTEKFWQWK